MRNLILSAASFIALTACYHATVETGATPSPIVIDKEFASSWIYGLVPPSTISTAEKCPHGVAKVETQHTFVNQLVGIITLGIYTPMQIRVTCAAEGSASTESAARRVVARGTGSAARQSALVQAVAQAVSTKQVVYVEF
jgi:hypothetical protein